METVQYTLTISLKNKKTLITNFEISKNKYCLITVIKSIYYLQYNKPRDRYYIECFIFGLVFEKF